MDDQLSEHSQDVSLPKCLKNFGILKLNLKTKQFSDIPTLFSPFSNIFSLWPIRHLNPKMSDNNFKILELSKNVRLLDRCEKNQKMNQKTLGLSPLNPQTRSYLKKSRKTEVHCRTCSFSNRISI